MKKRLLTLLTASLLSLSVQQGFAENAPKLAVKGDIGALSALSLDELAYRDDLGFTLLDYAMIENDPEVVRWLRQHGVRSGVNTALIQKMQHWLNLLDYPVDNFAGVFNPSIQQSVIAYKSAKNFEASNRITPDWFEGLEEEAIKEAQRLLNSMGEDLKLSGLLDRDTVAALDNFAGAYQNIPQMNYATFRLLKETAQGLMKERGSETLEVEIEEEYDLPPEDLQLGAVSDADLVEAADASLTQKAQAEARLSKNGNLPPDEVSIRYLNHTTNEKLDPETQTLVLNKIDAVVNNAPSNKILTIQTWLKIIGFFDHKVDGMTGPTTRSAIRDYQAHIGQKPTGIPDTKWEVPLEKEVRKKLQKRLKQLDFYHDDVNGVNNFSTRAATIAYERFHGLDELGNLSPRLLMFLFRDKELIDYGVRFKKTPIAEADRSTANQKNANVSSVPTAPTPISVARAESDETTEVTLQAAPIESNTTDSTVNAETTTPETVTPEEPVTLTPVPEKQAETNTPLTEIESIEALEEEEDAETYEIIHLVDDLDDVDEVDETPISEASDDEKIDETPRLTEFEHSIDEIKKTIFDAHSNTLLNRQVWLRIMGHFPYALDGAMGPQTREGITSYETSIGVEPTGKLAPKWEARLEKDVRKKVQARLKEKGFYEGDVDGLNGPGTRSAIRAYEASKKLPETGLLSPLFLMVLYNVDDLNPTDKDLAVFFEREGIQIKGYKPGGSDKLTLQQLMLAYTGDYIEVIDGKEGPATDEAVKRFQARYHLQIDGKIGGDTERRLTREVINTFQRFLKKEGYMEDDPTGSLGPKTKRAVRELKERSGIPVNDELDIPFMLVAIDGLAGTTLSDDYLAELKSAKAEEERLQTAQAYLIGLNLLTGKADGVDGPATQNAVRRFRQQEKLLAGTHVNEALMPFLEEAALKKGQSYLQQLGYSIKPDGKMGPNTKKQLHAFLTSKKMPISDVITAEILIELKNEANKKRAISNQRAPQAVQGQAASRGSAPKGTMPKLEKGYQEEGILSSAPNKSLSTSGKLKIVRNKSGQIMGCQVGNVSMGANYCSNYRNGQNCTVVYRQGRVISLRCK